MESQALAQETPATGQEEGTLETQVYTEFFDTTQLQSFIVGSLIILVIAIGIFVFFTIKKRQQDRATLNNFDADDKSPVERDDEDFAMTPDDEVDRKKK